MGSRLWQGASKSAFRSSSVVPNRFEDESNLAGVKCQRTTKWLGSSVGRVLAQ